MSKSEELVDSSNSDISLCESCNCMTKTVEGTRVSGESGGYCGKCKVAKPADSRSSETALPRIERLELPNSKLISKIARLVDNSADGHEGCDYDIGCIMHSDPLWKDLDKLISEDKSQAVDKANNEMAYKVYELLASYLIHSNPELADKAMKELSDYLQPYVKKQHEYLMENES